MKLDEIMDMCDEIFTIDKSNLSTEALESAKKYGRVLRVLAQERVMLKSFNRELEQVVLNATNFYAGRADPVEYKDRNFHINLAKNEVKTYVDADERVQKIKWRVDMQHEKIYYLENALKQIGFRNQQIKSYIDHEKLMNGGY